MYRIRLTLHNAKAKMKWINLLHYFQCLNDKMSEEERKKNCLIYLFFTKKTNFFFEFIFPINFTEKINTNVAYKIADYAYFSYLMKKLIKQYKKKKNLFVEIYQNLTYNLKNINLYFK